ncbi:cobalamin-independent methionine synthase II family protein [Erythrobacter sp. EC-HK427]|uniref:cobalamin-independent methionine synthase II family protein n=1 Tax=Erythrobacter sp. EC-HK427 TaxID=2038396 RepID=UPI00125BD20B|nr:cobalamin-independent methionine synthase II family protein [Erythrobacter sp. EC-HK427]VVT21021.1 Enterotoxin [Erythrobacter sp. EC-HK427]
MSAGRFLTTHVGSLPRPEYLLDLVFAKEEGADIVESDFDEAVERATAHIVHRQKAAGVDIINDGEMSKPSYATYIKHRLSGFGGEAGQYEFQDLEDYPGAKAQVFGNKGRAKRSAPACTAPIEVIDMDAPRQDAERLSRLADGHATFMSAASPGVTALFFPNQYYESDEAYVFALAEGLRHEYETIAAAGITLQVDCPDLAMGRHVQFTELSLEEFRKRIGMNIAALNHALQNIPAEQCRMHLCWGNYPGPHHCDVALGEIADIVWSAKPQTVLLEGANPRHAHEFAFFESNPLPDNKILCPGMVEPQSPYIEHPDLIAQRIGRYADLLGRERVLAGVDCGFSVHAGSNSLDPEIVWAKLAALAQGAAKASKVYW